MERGGVSGGGVGLACGGPARPLLTQALGNALINFKSSTSPVSGPHWKQMLSREGGGRRGGRREGGGVSGGGRRGEWRAGDTVRPVETQTLVIKSGDGSV